MNKNRQHGLPISAQKTEPGLLKNALFTHSLLFYFRDIATMNPLGKIPVFIDLTEIA
jgi:hypothetical protein